MKANSIAFPDTAEEFWADRPDDVTPWGWLFHPLNPFRFALWVAKFINKIRYYARRFNHHYSFFFQRTIASWLGVTEQWLREILRRLKLIGVLADRKVRKNRQYQINESIFTEIFRQTNGESCGENRSGAAANGVDTGAYSQSPSSHMQHQEPLTSNKVPIISPDDEFSSIIEQVISEAEITFQPERDSYVLAELRRQFTPGAIVVGVLLSKVRLVLTNGYANSKINSLKYCIPAIKEFADTHGGRLTHADGIARSLSMPMEYLRHVRRRLHQLKAGTCPLILKS